jgi:hypothetical protein
LRCRLGGGDNIRRNNQELDEMKFVIYMDNNPEDPYYEDRLEMTFTCEAEDRQRVEAVSKKLKEQYAKSYKMMVIIQDPRRMV